MVKTSHTWAALKHQSITQMRQRLRFCGAVVMVMVPRIYAPHNVPILVMLLVGAVYFGSNIAIARTYIREDFLILLFMHTRTWNTYMLNHLPHLNVIHKIAEILLNIMIGYRKHNRAHSEGICINVAGIIFGNVCIDFVKGRRKAGTYNYRMIQSPI